MCAAGACGRAAANSTAAAACYAAPCPGSSRSSADAVRPVTTSGGAPRACVGAAACPCSPGASSGSASAAAITSASSGPVTAASSPSRAASISLLEANGARKGERYHHC